MQPCHQVSTIHLLSTLLILLIGIIAQTIKIRPKLWETGMILLTWHYINDILHMCICDVILLGYGVVSVSDSTLELFAGFSDLSHRLHPLILLPERAHLHREQRHLQATQENDTDVWVTGLINSRLLPVSNVNVTPRGAHVRDWCLVDPVCQENDWPMCVCVELISCKSCTLAFQTHRRGWAVLAQRRQGCSDVLYYKQHQVHSGTQTGEDYICITRSSKCYS